jgi:hypothetical protein
MIGQAVRHAVAILVMTLPVLVHVHSQRDAFAQATQSPTQSTQSAKKAQKGDKKSGKPVDSPDTLPRGVAYMVDAILEAVRSGLIADLDDAIDWNEMKPDLGPQVVSNPVAYWKSISKDGEGREILDILGKLLAGKPAIVPLGKDIENNRLYVWPAFADTPLSKLSPAEMEALTALTTNESLTAMREKNRYTGWRLVIGADGTWHSFRPD